MALSPDCSVPFREWGSLYLHARPPVEDSHTVQSGYAYLIYEGAATSIILQSYSFHVPAAFAEILDFDLRTRDYVNLTLNDSAGRKYVYNQKKVGEKYR